MICLTRRKVIDNIDLRLEKKRQGMIALSFIFEMSPYTLGGSYDNLSAIAVYFVRLMDSR